VDGLETEWGEQVRVVRLNVQGAGVEPLLQRLNFRFTPTFILLDGNGQEAWRTVGSLPTDEARRQAAALQ